MGAVAQLTPNSQYKMLVEIGLFLLTIFLGLYFWITKNFGYFKANGLPEAPGTFPFGSEHMWDLMLRKTSFTKQFDGLIEKFKDEKVFGIYNFRQRDIVVKDLELAKKILIKDADHFIDRPAINLDGVKNESDKIVKYFLTNLTGEQWKKVRSVISPVFTSGKLKLMVPHIQKCTENLDDVLGAAADSGEMINVRELFGKYTLDAIATSGFGIESNSFKDPDSVFRKTALRMVRAEGYNSKMDILKFLVLIISPKFARFIGLTMMPTGTVEFFTNIIRQTVEQRRISGKRRNDIIDLLLDEIKKMEEENDQETKTEENIKKDDFDEEMVLISNALIFFFAGFDTTSLTLATVMFAFMDKPYIQDKVRQEINEVIGDSKSITVEHLKDLKYMENVINEALRFYGIVNNLQRKCTKEYRIPGTDFTISKDMIINVTSNAFSSECFFNHDQFDPNNFDSINNPNKFGFTGFGQGPRNCVGMRYAYMALKLALIRTITKYKVVKCEKTVDKLTFDIAKNNFNGGVWMKVEHFNDVDIEE